MSEQEKFEEEQTPELDAANDETEQHEEAAVSEENEESLVEKLQGEVGELKDRLLRTMAEMENVRRRAEKDKADANAYAVTGFARDMLNVSDNLRRALDSMPEEVADDIKAFSEGVEMTERELLNTLERHGITKVLPEVGEKFDHKLHQAMFEVPTDDHPTGTVMQVVAPGYVIKDRLLRPAMVGVAKGGASKVDTEA
jgi:molecular chaperone GrpE